MDRIQGAILTEIFWFNQDGEDILAARFFQARQNGLLVNLFRRDNPFYMSVRIP
jgi:hypothetical protein